ncbi:MAG TPA: DUF4097 family beta strand repeat-containing protein [Gemmatimonadaceae bacterium]|jgi:hypothetical protein|nr:DUF4097 family beta strand repeat-containing protein [Gemmatimonadaceae bacterium]
MNRMLIGALAAVLLVPGVIRGQEQEFTGDTLQWRQAMQPGSWLRVRNMNGEVRVEGTTGNTAEVVGIKSYRRGDPEDVKFVVIKEGNDVAICALWGERSSCSIDDYRAHWNGRGRDDVTVDFTVKLPRGVKVHASSVNGAVDVADATAEVEANTVNGRVEVSTSTGPVSANTVNGGVIARMSTLPGTADMRFGTVNGSVRVIVPSEFDAEVEMSTVNGRLRTDFPITLSGRIDPKRLSARIGKGGRRVTMKTVNGSVDLEKQN